MTTATPQPPHIHQLRDHLLQTLASLRDRTNPMEPDRARAVAQVASVLVDTARVEVDFIKATGQDTSQFMQAALPGETRTTATGNTVQKLPNGTTIHRMGG